MRNKKNRRFKENRNKKTTSYIIIVSALILVLAMPLLITVSRYAIESINNYFSRTKEFYFLSDKLTTNNYSYLINNWSGVDPYTIVINMSSMENNLLKATYDIEYDITYTASSKVDCQISKTSGLIPATTNKDSFTLTLTPNTTLYDGNSVTVEITTVSKTAYDKTLQARFTLRVGQEQLSYSIVDKPHSIYLLSNITNTLSYYVIRVSFGSYNINDRISIATYRALPDVDKAKCSSAEIMLSFDPTQYVIDMTNKNYLNALNVTYTNISGTNYIDSITFAVDALSSTNVRFYKTNVVPDNTYPAPGMPSPVVTFTYIR